MDVVEVEGMRRGGESCSGKDEGGGGGGGGGGREVEETSLPHPLYSLSLFFFFLIVAHSIVKNLFSSPAFHCRNNQRWQQKFSPREYCANARKLQVQSDAFKCLPCNMEFTIG